MPERDPNLHPGDPGYEEPEPETEEERAHREIQIQTEGAVNESLESTRRMLALAEESKEAGIKTLVFLDEQGDAGVTTIVNLMAQFEQLDRIEEGMDKINTDMKDAEKSLEGLEKCCGLCVLPWKKQKTPGGGDYDASWKNPDDGGPQSEGPRPMVGNAMGPTGPMVGRITDDAREDEMEENLQQVGSMIGNLRNMAIDMGNEIEGQNKAMDRINRKAQSNETRVVEANKRANKLLKS